MISLSARALEMVRTYAGQMPDAAGMSLRIFVQGGGCCGVQYGFTFDDHQDGDTLVEQGGITILIDPTSAPYLAGATVDFVEDERGAGFVVEPAGPARPCCCGPSAEAE